METVRMTITMPTATKDAIKALAAQLGITESAAAQHLLKLGLTVEAIAFGGGEVWTRSDEGEERVLADQIGNYTHRQPVLTR